MDAWTHSIGLIADLHDHAPNLAVFAAVAHRHKFGEVWCAGDIGSPATYASLLAALPLPIRAVAGNLESDYNLAAYQRLAQSHPNFTFYPAEPAAFSCGDLAIFLYHHPVRDQQMKTNAPAIVMSGHTHAPTLARHDATWWVNPGTLSGWPVPATYAILKLHNSQPKFGLHRL